MLKTRLLLFAVCVAVIVLLFQLPKAVVENESSMAGQGAETDSVSSHLENVAAVPNEFKGTIQRLRAQLLKGAGKEKNAIFADSLADLYRLSNRFDSAAWFAEESARGSSDVKSWTKAGDNYYQAFSIELDQGRQMKFAQKAQEFYGKVLEKEPRNLEVKTKLAMTYVTTATPMQGITMLREVLNEDPNNELALFNMGMLSIQSGQYDRAVQRLQQLVNLNPLHIQGQLLLGIALMNSGSREKAAEQFRKVKQMDNDPAVQATVDSYLKDLK